MIRFLEALDAITDQSWWMRWMLAALMLKIAAMDHSVIWALLGSIVVVSSFSGLLLSAIGQLKGVKRL